MDFVTLLTLLTIATGALLLVEYVGRRFRDWP